MALLTSLGIGLTIPIMLASDPHKVVVCLMGPTASGKTNLAVELVQRLAMEIVSVDSVMVYRGLDIGSAKPSLATLAQAPHRLIDICEPHQPYSAADFCRDARDAIEDILSQGKTPLLVGGTMLYFRALQQGLSQLPAANPLLRERLNIQAQQLGWPALHARLNAVDPQAAQRIHPNDPQRLQRALEVYELTGKSLTSLQQHNNCFPSYHFVNIALMVEDRDDLRQKIMTRFEQMLVTGLVDEVKSLWSRHQLSGELPAMRAVGYRQVCDYLTGRLSYEQMQQRAVIASRQLAKRQLTWLRSWSGLKQFSSQDSELFDKVKRYIVSNQWGRYIQEE